MTQPNLPERIPMTILTGFLGAGKTTLLNNILNGDHGLRVAVLVNDFGSVNIDSKLIVGLEGDTISLSNGCICCTIRGDMLYSVVNLLQRDDPPEYIIIEASGVSDPAQIVVTFTRSALRNNVEIASVLTVIDAEQFDQIDSDYVSLAKDQVRTADIVVINKVDLVTPDDIDRMRAWVTGIAPKARVIETTYSRVPLTLIMDNTTHNPQWAFVKQPHDVHVHDAEEKKVHMHSDHSLVFSSWTWRSEKPLSLQALYRVLENLPATIWRAKGIVYTRELPDRRGVLQIVGKRASIVQGDPWDDETPHTEIVMIGKHGSIDAGGLRRQLEGTISEASEEVGTTLGDVVDGVLRWLRRK